MKLGYDNDKYIRTQSAHIRERIAQFGGKLYLEFGGKLFDDYHASRVLPGFEPDSKIRMLLTMKEDVEIVVAINAAPRPRELRAFFSCMAWRAIPGPLSKRKRRLDSLEAAQGLQETRVATREESGVLGFPSRRGLTPRGSLECNPEIPSFPGLEY